MSELQPAKGQHGRWSADFIDKVLWEVAAAGGQVSRGYSQLQHWALLVMEETGEMPDLPSERTVRDWVASRYRNRYHEVQQSKVTEMDERIAQTGARLAIQMADAEERALKQTLAGLASCNGVEASVVLRNLSQSKKIQVDNAVTLRTQSAEGIDVRGITELAAAIVRAGAGILEGPVIPEAEVVEEPTVVPAAP